LRSLPDAARTIERIFSASRDVTTLARGRPHLRSAVMNE
jgi:hypothetical protein